MPTHHSLVNLLTVVNSPVLSLNLCTLQPVHRLSYSRRAERLTRSLTVESQHFQSDWPTRRLRISRASRTSSLSHFLSAELCDNTAITFGNTHSLSPRLIYSLSTVIRRVSANPKKSLTCFWRILSATISYHMWLNCVILQVDTDIRSSTRHFSAKSCHVMSARRAYTHSRRDLRKTAFLD